MTEHLIRPVYTPDDWRLYAEIAAWAASLEASQKHIDDGLSADDLWALYEQVGGDLP